MDQQPILIEPKLTVKLLTVQGLSTELFCVPSDTVKSLSQRVYEQWPENWSSIEKPSKNILRVIYHGRFLHDNVKLSDLSLALDKVTVMHLVCRENLPDPPKPDENEENKTGRSGCCTLS
jgi:hypothetical protein